MDGPMIRTFIGCYIYKWAQTHSISILTTFMDGLLIRAFIEVLHLPADPWAEYVFIYSVYEWASALAISEHITFKNGPMAPTFIYLSHFSESTQ